jgi:hypothetical protein
MSKQKFTYKSVFVALKPSFNPNQSYAGTSTGTFIVGNDQQEHQAAGTLESILEFYAKEGYQMKSITKHNHGVIVVFESYSEEYDHYNKELVDYVKS